MFACEAKFHAKCRKDYTREYIDSRDIGSSEEIQMTSSDAHSYAFAKVCAVVDQELIHKVNVLKLSDLN